MEVSPDLISRVTDAVVTEVTEWQTRPLEPVYPVVFVDALRVKIRDEAVVRSKAAYLALGVLPDGTRGCHDILIAVLVHLIRHSLDLVSWKYRKTVAAALRTISTATTTETAQAALDTFAAGPWGTRVPTMVKSWRRAWPQVIPCFVYPPEGRRVIYTTNAIESINARVRKIMNRPRS